MPTSRIYYRAHSQGCNACHGRPLRCADVFHWNTQYAGVPGRTMQAMDTFWKGSSTKGYFFAIGPSQRGSLSVPMRFKLAESCGDRLLHPPYHTSIATFERRPLFAWVRLTIELGVQAPRGLVEVLRHGYLVGNDGDYTRRALCVRGRLRFALALCGLSAQPRSLTRGGRRS